MAGETQAAKPETGRSFLAEIGDFLFATDTIAKIAKGKGTWGDAALVGVTAASFFIPPAKLGMLSSKALNAVIKASTKAVESETISVAAKRAASKTLNDALTMKRQGYIPTGDEPVKLVGQDSNIKSLVEKQRKEFNFQKRMAEYEKRTPGSVVEGESKTYSRVSDEEYDYFNPKPDPQQAAEDAMHSKLPSYVDKETKKYVANPKITKEQQSRADADMISKSERYDQTNFTQDQIDERIANLSKKELNSPELKRQKGETERSHRNRLEEYVRGGEFEVRQTARKSGELSSPVSFEAFQIRSGNYTDEEIFKVVEAFRNKTTMPTVEAEAKLITDIYLSYRKIIKDEVLKKRSKIKRSKTFEYKRPDGTIEVVDRSKLLKDIKSSFGEIKKEFKEKVVDTAAGKAILKNYEKEMAARSGQQFTKAGDIKPTETLLRYEDNLADDAAIGKQKVFADEVIDETPITPTQKDKTLFDKGMPKYNFSKKTLLLQNKLLKQISNDPKVKNVTPSVLRAARLMAEKTKLEAYNATNSTAMKKATREELLKLKQSSARNKKSIDKIDNELRGLASLPREQKMQAQYISDQIKELGMKAKYNPKGGKYVTDAPEIKPSIPGKGGSTAKLTTQGKIAKAKAEIENLREQWKAIPESNVEARKKIADEAKKFADYIKRLEGK